MKLGTAMSADGSVRLFLGGDLMTGRGIDQILPHPSSPELYESWVRDAGDYVALAERVSGPIPRGAPFDYVWGDALAELERQQPALRIVNLETSITRSARHAPAKGIHYRMHPDNLPCLTAAGIDCCVLANNHVLDWGREGLIETLAVLERAGIAVAGAGRDDAEAARPAVLTAGAGRRLEVFACGVGSSGIPANWAAAPERPGVQYVPDCSRASVDQLVGWIVDRHVDGALVLASLHWGGNWGYAVPDEHVRLAHRLVDEAGVHLVHGHSSHHPLGIEVYRDRLILYGCGDLLNDYEGISGYESFRSDLTAMYFPELDARTGELTALVVVPVQIRRLRLNRPAPEDAAWLAERLGAQSRRFGVGFAERDGRLQADW
ncbi:MAG TPA: CapA family protein [Pseudomonadales bacterium]